MSKKNKKEEIIPVPINPNLNPCICSLSQLVILILIILQFSNGGKGTGKVNYENQQISNEVLFIIALYFLTCIECSYRYPYPISIIC